MGLNYCMYELIMLTYSIAGVQEDTRSCGSLEYPSQAKLNKEDKMLFSHLE